MMTTLTRLAALAAAIVATPLAVHAAPPKVSCPDSPSTARAGDPLFAMADLLPGATLATPGSAPTVVNLHNETHAYAIASSGGPITGTIAVSIGRDDEDNCVVEHSIVVDASAAGCIRWLEINGFGHPASGLVGDYRNDSLPFGIASTLVKRSPGAGNRIRFRMMLCPGEQSRQLYLDTSLGAAIRTGTVKVRAVDGSLSNAIPAFVPTTP